MLPKQQHRWWKGCCCRRRSRTMVRRRMMLVLVKSGRRSIMDGNNDNNNNNAMMMTTTSRSRMLATASSLAREIHRSYQDLAVSLHGTTTTQSLTVVQIFSTSGWQKSKTSFCPSVGLFNRKSSKNSLGSDKKKDKTRTVSFVRERE